MNLTLLKQVEDLRAEKKQLLDKITVRDNQSRQRQCEFAAQRFDEFFSKHGFTISRSTDGKEVTAGYGTSLFKLCISPDSVASQPLTLFFPTQYKGATQLGIRFKPTPQLWESVSPEKDTDDNERLKKQADELSRHIEAIRQSEAEESRRDPVIFQITKGQNTDASLPPSSADFNDREFDSFDDLLDYLFPEETT